ncbi:Guanylate-binding protein 1 [Anabarilius grahami]|uniref:Guanylate-binding protein 1 n=1 Tax=Anabarilius grahami TaxID=495550 RepID=A0A3N0XM47_ANAGA|nr:Guanylate-binding protein 1 [Anabarilius grahami]
MAAGDALRPEREREREALRVRRSSRSAAGPLRRRQSFFQGGELLSRRAGFGEDQRREDESSLKEKGLNMQPSRAVKNTFPVSTENFTCEHLKFSSLATSKFMKRSFKDEKGEYLKTLEEAVSMKYIDLMEENEMASERKCRDLLKNLFSDMNKRLQNGEYIKSGGYELYCRDRDSIVKQYRREPNKGVRAEAVLNEFLNEQGTEANSILHTDTKLTENERQIKEEKENAALLEQKYKEEEEKKIERERMIVAEKERHEDRVRQMEEKFKQELEQQRQEMDRAIESKVKEREEMLNKGFKERAKNLEEEIKKLNNEKERIHGGGIFKDYVMPFLCPLVEMVPNLLMQRSMMKCLKKGFNR